MVKPSELKADANAHAHATAAAEVIPQVAVKLPSFVAAYPVDLLFHFLADPFGTGDDVFSRSDFLCVKQSQRLVDFLADCPARVPVGKIRPARVQVVDPA